ncbi:MULTISPECIES: deoxynucleoside kinase [Leuconostoc]|jgi:deoxyadenosine/deoxycytidine kinase|uniref:Deoxynucleoside kinase n=1 Tax=Leuconostoc falkenbergense TaxID=2766470 RepID=A0A9X3E7U0_9LACO|nr:MULTISPECIES: deoxynucleoside kinase [Leuconostoc]KDA47422.1 Deoxyadenosine kinase/Deoxyguanosine kinase [Leuconostoc pseudomesenteroides 1159]KDA49202.1 Deoxyadenosine kinase/Deoxyguanosine kinase [Leuconostoc pseudomesenteroides PS12]OQJ69170.1 deoxynucleoside kinase [Leuconostoc pseudomesenteroides]CCJ66758.1 Deoxyadenosine kinase / Deoxyguanosine kinase [Leuconostoc pseudomesenteroides 4882]MCT4377999.1 deoxynucleoside kinase [Leuconostoc falkenbergense]
MIVLSGTIGAGKTSLTKMLAQHLDSEAFYESVDDNPILPLFYEDPKKYGFLLQIYFLNKRLAQIKKAQVVTKNILDRSIFEDALLFQLTADLDRATQTEVDIYKSLVDNMMAEIPGGASKDPDLLIHVRVSFDTMLARIKKRGRSYEQIDENPSLYEYYQELNSRYDDWFENYDRSPKIQIDGDRFDFVENPKARAEVFDMIDAKLSETGVLSF